MSLYLIAFAITLLISPSFSYKAVVLVHGVMTGSGSMEMIGHRIQEKHPGTVVYNVNRFESWSSLETMWHQVMEIGQDVANISSKHPEGINVLGYSQGGLIARGIIQTYPNVSVSTFISLSSPQAGQYGAGFLHLVFPGLLKESAYELFYSRVGQYTSVGNYWNDPYHQTLYESYSVYLPYINNHLPSAKSADFKANMLKLKRLVLIGGPDDQVITPWQSSQFGYYDGNETVVEMRGQNIYLEDKIGLRTLDESGRLHVVTVPGVSHFSWHMNFLLDTGSEMCCFPRRLIHDHRKATDFDLSAANGSCFKTYGSLSLKLNLGLKRYFTWNFVVADVSTAIIGSDFLAYNYDLLPDCRNILLLDGNTNMAVPVSMVINSQSSVNAVVSVASPFSELFSNFPDII